MIHTKHLLLIALDLAELRIGSLLSDRGIETDLTEVDTTDALAAALTQPRRWDLVLCDADHYFELGVHACVAPVRAVLDASLVLVETLRPHRRQPAFDPELVIADVVALADADRLLMVCERELGNAALRKELRAMRESLDIESENPSETGSGRASPDGGMPDRKTYRASGRKGGESETAEGKDLDSARVRALIDANGLVLEFQPIISLRSGEERLAMFESLVRLRDECGQLLLPGEFLPAMESAGWMTHIDLWILRRALSKLRDMQIAGEQDTVLFINVATRSLCCEKTAKAIGAFISAARLSAGSVVIEVRKSAFVEAAEAVQRLGDLLRAQGHGLLLEDPDVQDCGFLSSHRQWITHIKLGRSLMQGLVERRVSQGSLNLLVRCAQGEGMRVIALAVDNAELLHRLFGAGVDAIQGYFTGMPYQSPSHPSIQRVESSSSSGWTSPTRIE